VRAETTTTSAVRVPPMASSSEEAWQALDEVLRRLVGRLCVAARGQSTQLDAQLGRVAATMRKRAPAGEIEQLMTDLARAIAALDEQPVGVSRHLTAALPPQATLAQAAQAVVRLLERLALDPGTHSRVAEIKTQVLAANSEPALADAVDRMAELVNEQLQQIQRDKGEVERTLKQVNEQLDEVAAYLFGEDADRASAQQSGRQLEGEVLGELAGIDASVREASDLDTLRDAVTRRTRAIHTHVNDFREREAARIVAYQERADRMRSRIGELERETVALQQSLRREKRLSVTDALTGIPNRLAWDERIAHEFARWKRFRRPMCIAAWDIDHFKSINDTFGHSAGDKVLYVVAQHLARGVREVDFVSRYGGEEFTMLLLGTRPEDALRVCDALRERVAKLNFHFRQKPIMVTLSCGIAVFGDDDTPETVLERADLAMYEAKRTGRNACRIG
jgi:diguanylate cyclase